MTGGGSTRTVRLTLAATASTGGSAVVAGRYESTSTDGALGGEAGGVVTGSTVSLTFTPTPPQPCGVTQPFPVNQWLLSLTLDGTRMSGDGTITLCGGSERAQATFTKP